MNTAGKAQGKISLEGEESDLKKFES